MLQEQEAQMKVLELCGEVVLLATVFSYDFSILNVLHFQKYKMA